MTLKKRLTHFVTLMMAVLLCAACLAAFPQDAYAASAETEYVPTKIVTTSKTQYGDMKYVYNFAYYDTGLLKSKKATSTMGTYSSFIKQTFKRNGSGLVSSSVIAGDLGKTGSTKSTIKNGKMTKENRYSIEGETKTLANKVKYTYKNGRVSKSVSVSPDKEHKATTTYYPNGKEKKSVNAYKTDGYNTKTTILYNKKGNAVKSVYAYNYTNSKSKTVTTTKYTYDKKGNPTKIVDTVKSTSDGETSVYTRTTENKYTYVHGDKISRCESSTIFTDSEGNPYNAIEETTKYTYKKVNVAKKYQKYFNRDIPGAYMDLSTSQIDVPSY